MTRRKAEISAPTVGGQIQRTARSPFMLVSEVTVNISTDLNDRAIYSIPGSKTKSNEQLFGLARVALDEIKDTAGILILESGPVPGMQEMHCITWQVKGRRDHPDGFVQTEIATYMLDLRLSGERFDPDAELPQDAGGRYYELFEGYLEKAIGDRAKKLSIAWPGDRAEQAMLVEGKMGDEWGDWYRRERAKADQRARREVTRMRPHITRRAETGAIHALIRNMLGVQHAYTIPQLQQGIRLLRAQINREALDMLPEPVRIRLLTAEAVDALGINPETVAALMPGEQVRPGPQEPEPMLEEALEGYLDGEQDFIDAQVITDEPEEPEGQASESEEKTESGQDSRASDELAPILAELGDDATIEDGKHRYLVQKVFAEMGLKPPKWGDNPTVAQISEQIKETMNNKEVANEH